MLTFFSLALCAACGCETIGGRGHDCKPPEEETPPITQFERLVMLIGRGELIARMAKARQ